MTNNSANVKETAENLLIQIVEYLNKAEPDDEERDHRLKELACSLITSTIDFNKNIDDILKDINDICLDIRNLSMAGAFRYKSGDETNVKRIWS
jgi:hypothetical protein